MPIPGHTSSSGTLYQPHSTGDLLRTFQVEQALSGV